MEAQGPQGSAGTQTRTPPGWYADPEGPGQRYWDGDRWTEHRSATPPPPPGATAPRRKRRGGTFLKVTLGVIVGGCVLIAGCAALLAGGINNANNEQKKKGITVQQFHGERLGTPQSQVEADLGKPEDAQEFENKGVIPGSAASRSSCIYYSEKGKGIGEGHSFQLCFDNGKLNDKNAY